MKAKHVTHLAYVPSGTSGMESELEAAKGDEEKKQVKQVADKPITTKTRGQWSHNSWRLWLQKQAFREQKK